VGQSRVLPDQLSGLPQCCNGLFFVGAGIKSDGYNFFQPIAIFAHQVISRRAGFLKLDCFRVFTGAQ
jgi:hypothetical protein